jgi:GNAT superfamily N-acetyltransferase
VARRLMTAIVEWCSGRGFPVAWLHASDEGRPLYESMGFEPTNEMKLNLAANRSPGETA